MNVHSLVIEMGRQCNQQCEHCLRGPAETKKINLSLAKKAIDAFETIGSITFTGGEPTLYAKEICELMDYIMENEKSVSGFWIVSNGIIVDMNLIFKCAEMYAYCDENYGDAEYSCGFEISDSQFHEPISEKNRRFLHAFRFVSFRGEIHERGLINEGMAYENGIGNRTLDYDKDFYIQDDEIEMVYLNAEGFVFPDCDFSYETQREIAKFTFDQFVDKFVAAVPAA